MRARLYERVVEFMERFGQPFPAPFVPKAPPDDVVRNRCRWQLEETLELLEACFPGWDSPPRPPLELFKKQLLAGIESAPVKVDLVAYADANADIRYVAYGNDIAAGIYSPDVDAEVCRSNDTKSPPGPDGKVRKGEAFSPADVAGVLKEQGWKECSSQPLLTYP